LWRTDVLTALAGVCVADGFIGGLQDYRCIRALELRSSARSSGFIRAVEEERGFRYGTFGKPATETAIMRPILTLTVQDRTGITRRPVAHNKARR
jgi:hypothetical protein